MLAYDPRMARNEPQVNVRVPAALLKKLHAAIEESGRSLTSEIVYRLDWSFGFREQLKRTQEQLLEAERAVEKAQRENEMLREAMDKEDGVDRVAEADLPEGRKLVLRMWRAQLRAEAALKDLQRLFPGVGSLTFRDKFHEDGEAPPPISKKQRQSPMKPRSRKR